MVSISTPILSRSCVYVSEEPSRTLFRSQLFAGRERERDGGGDAVGSRDCYEKTRCAVRLLETQKRGERVQLHRTSHYYNMMTDVARPLCDAS